MIDPREVAAFIKQFLAQRDVQATSRAALRSGNLGARVSAERSGGLRRSPRSGDFGTVLSARGSASVTKRPVRAREGQ
jgi:hypothetical protein